MRTRVITLARGSFTLLLAAQPYVQAGEKIFGHLASLRVGGQDVKFLLPDTYMNESGKSLAPARDFKIAPSDIHCS